MIQPNAFLDVLSDCNINFFTGVPDSLLKDICAYIQDTKPATEHIISANEGTAMATALGYHLATGSTLCISLS
jgi:phosphonopyruvate decarboxylase